MLRSRPFIALLAALALVGACSEGGPSTTGASGTGTSGPTRTGSDPNSCPYEDYGARATPLVQVRPPSAQSPTELTERRRLPCVTSVAVEQNGAANIEFGRTVRCQVTQDQQDADKVARITTRDPRDALFRMGVGRAVCTMAAPGKVIELCGQGTLLIDEPMQAAPVCNPDPVFRVDAYAGSVRVIDPEGEGFTLPPGSALVYDFESGSSRIENAQFNPPDVTLFEQQAAALGLQPLLRRRPEVNSDGGVLFATQGDWSAAPPLDIAFQWQGACSSFDDDATCTDIAGATDQSYTPSESDCPAVRVVVTATNASGQPGRVASSPFDLSTLGLCSPTTTTPATGATGATDR